MRLKVGGAEKGICLTRGLFPGLALFPGLRASVHATGLWF